MYQFLQIAWGQSGLKNDRKKKTDTDAKLLTNLFVPTSQSKLNQKTVKKETAHQLAVPSLLLSCTQMYMRPCLVITHSSLAIHQKHANQHSPMISHNLLCSYRPWVLQDTLRIYSMDKYFLHLIKVEVSITRCIAFFKVSCNVYHNPRHQWDISRNDRLPSCFKQFVPLEFSPIKPQSCAIYYIRDFIQFLVDFSAYVFYT